MLHSKKRCDKSMRLSPIKEIEVVYNASPKADGDKRTAADSYMSFVRQFPEANKATSRSTSLLYTTTS